MTFDPGALPPPTPPGLPGTPGAVDVLTADPSGRSGRRWAWVAVGAAVVVLLATVAGAAGAVRWWRGTAPALAAFLPSDVTSVGAIDLDPPGQQKVDAVRLLSRLPRDAVDGATDLPSSGGSLIADALTGLLGVPEQTIAATSGTWFGGQVAGGERPLGHSSLLGDEGTASASAPARTYVAMTVSDLAAFEQAWESWAGDGRKPAAQYLERDGVVVVGDGTLDALPATEADSIAATPAFQASGDLREGALMWLWVSTDLDEAYPAPGGRPSFASAMRLRSDGIDLSARVYGSTPKVLEAAPPPASGAGVIAAVSVAPMDEALLSLGNAYHWSLDPTDQETSAAIDLLAGTIGLAAFTGTDDEVGLAVDMRGGGKGAAALKELLLAPSDDAVIGDQAASPDSALDPDADPLERQLGLLSLLGWGFDLDQALSWLRVDGDDAVVRYHVPEGTTAVGTAPVDAVPDSSAPLQAYVDVPALLASPLADGLAPDEGDQRALLEELDTIGVSVVMPEDGRADIAVRVLLLP